MTIFFNIGWVYCSTITLVFKLTSVFSKLGFDLSNSYEVF
jgi:hypothetical protein